MAQSLESNTGQEPDFQNYATQYPPHMREGDLFLLRVVDPDAYACGHDFQGVGGGDEPLPDIFFFDA
jgi:hypothetical protein